MFVTKARRTAKVIFLSWSLNIANIGNAHETGLTLVASSSLDIFLALTLSSSSIATVGVASPAQITCTGHASGAIEPIVSGHAAVALCAAHTWLARALTTGRALSSGGALCVAGTLDTLAGRLVPVVVCGALVAFGTGSIVATIETTSMTEFSIVNASICLAIALTLFTFMSIGSSGKGPRFGIIQGLALLTINPLRIMLALASTGSKTERDE